MARTLLLGVLLLLPRLALGQAQPTPPYAFAEGSIVGVVTDNPQFYRAIFINSGYPQYTPAAGQWQTINWKDYGLPPDIKAVMLGGMLIITHGYSPVICHETITFARPGSTIDPGNYIFQSLDPPFIGSGVRQTAFTIVPVANGQTWWMWRRGSPAQYPAGGIGQYPSECAYAVNLNVQGYVR